MKHRHDGQHLVGAAQPEGVAGADRQGVQVHGAVGVDDALGVSGGAAGVAHRGGLAFVDVLGPVVDRGGSGEQVLVGVQVLAGPGERSQIGVPDDDHVLDRLHLRKQGGQQWYEGGVDDDDLVLGVFGDVEELLGEEPDVEGVQDGAHRGDGQVGLEVLVAVPHEGGDPLVGVDAEIAEGAGQPRGPLAELGVGGAPYAVAGIGADLAGTEHGGGVSHDRGDGEREVLHGGKHRPLPVRVF